MYFLPDCRHKRQMQEMFTHPRSALVAPRASGKTFTVCYELVPFVCITRPNTNVLLGSETKDLTVEKLKEIKKRVQKNPFIYADFGQVYPMRRTSLQEWGASCLDFNNGSQVKGSSIDQATRGRHPMVGIIDDPEGKRAKNPKWRDAYMKWLFQDYLNQFDDKGTHVMWIGTLLDVDSCLWRAVHNEDPENRFVAWQRHILKLIDTDDEGRRVSAWPEKLTVEEFDRKLRGGEDEDGSVTVIGLHAAMAEFQGEPMPSGSMMFVREQRKHGYVLAEDDNGERYFYDPATGESRSLTEMQHECHKVMGVDVADTETKDADASGIVCIYYDHKGRMWIVDAWTRRCFSDVTAGAAMKMGHDWKIGQCAWESVALGKRIYREAWTLRQQRVEAGFHAPQLIPVTTDGIPKVLRIERMRPDFDAGLIKIPCFTEIDGHKPWKNPNAGALRELTQQFDKMTDETRRGVDLLDACEMGRRLAVSKPHRYIHHTDQHNLYEEWEKKGVDIEPAYVERKHWTKRMKEEFRRRVEPQFVKEAGGFDALE
jgi:hypothetical protein